MTWLYNRTRAFARSFAAVALAAMALSAAGPALAQSVERVQFPGPSGQPAEALVWTPDTAPAGLRPLVVISHGSVGSSSGHQDTAAALAGAGFVVAALAHPGDNYRDFSRSMRLTERPGQVSALITWMTQDWRGAATIDASRIGAFGFSAGGFTVLTLAGGESDATAILDHCASRPAVFVCTLATPETLNIPGWNARGADPRVKAVVAAAPGFGFSFSGASLRTITIPVQLWQAGEDQILAAPFHVETVRDRLSGDAEYHLVPGALHHDFLAPCTPETRVALAELCRSGPGFDRAAFKQTFNQEVARFFSHALNAP